MSNTIRYDALLTRHLALELDASLRGGWISGGRAIAASASRGASLVRRSCRASKACIGTQVGGIPEVIDDGTTGLLVPPHDPSALASAIVGLLRDHERRARMGRAGLARVTAEFSVERMVQGTLAAYKRAAGTPR